MQKLCFIYSSIGGPRSLNALLHSQVHKDVIYLIYQPMPSEEFVNALIHCLEEELPLKFQYVRERTLLDPGAVYFLSNQNGYRFDGGALDVMESVEHPLDRLLMSLAASKYGVAGVVLSGLLEDQDGMEGFKALKQAGSKFYACTHKYAPVYSLIQEMDALGWVDAKLPPQSLLSNLEFVRGRPEVVGEDHWLIVDDEKVVRELIGEILGEENISCDYAGDGLDALRKIQTNKYAALILDIKMPELDGMKTLTALQTIDPDIPILIITGYDDQQARQAAKTSNVMGLLLKPFTSQSLKDFIPQLKRRIVSERSSLS